MVLTYNGNTAFRLAKIFSSIINVFLWEIWFPSNTHTHNFLVEASRFPLENKCSYKRHMLPSKTFFLWKTSVCLWSMQQVQCVQSATGPANAMWRGIDNIGLHIGLNWRFYKYKNLANLSFRCLSLSFYGVSLSHYLWIIDRKILASQSRRRSHRWHKTSTA